MDVIRFLCVSQDSRTVQLHDTLLSRRVCTCSEAGFSSQKRDHAWGVFYRRPAFSCAFLWAKGLSVIYIHKEVFSVYCGKCLTRKPVHNWVTNVFLWWNGSAEVAETTLRRLVCCGFRRIIKRRDKSFNVAGWYVEKWMLFHFQVRISNVLRFISVCDLFTGSPSYLNQSPL
jgi:hypothetical protein